MSSLPVPTLPAQDSTIPFIRRTLAPNSSPATPLESLLPALTSDSTVDLELYAIIAIIYREFIYPWYHSLTTSPTFPAELNLLLAHITLTLESRLRSLDLASFLTVFLPSVVEAEINAARERADDPGWALLEEELRVHPAEEVGLKDDFSEAKATEEYWRVVSNELVEILIPAEEREVHAAAVFARELLVKILCIVCEVLDKEYIWLESIMKLLDDDGHESMHQSWPDKILSAVEWGFRGVKFVGETLYEAYILPLKHQNGPQRPKPRSTQKQEPILLDTPLFSLFATILDLPATRPWTPSFLKLLTLPLQTRSPLSSALNRRLYSLILRPLTTPDSIAKLLRISRSAFFPENHLPPPRAEPDEKELRRLRENLWRKWNSKFGRAVGGREALGWIRYAKRGRLVRMVVEGLLAGLFSELAVKEEEM